MKMSSNQVRWLPLESNPDVMNKYLKNMGVPEKFHFVDIYGFDDDLLNMVPRPVYALLLLYPLHGTADVAAAQESQGPKEVYFVKQKIGNACGTIALIHALGNNVSNIDLSGGPFKEFYDKTKSLSPEEICKELESNKKIAAVHEESAQEGQTATPNREEHVDLHFICFVNVGNTIYELDGRKSFPVSHGKTSAESFLLDAANVCRKFIKNNPDNLRFTAVALVSA